jgi:hypothetical protein
LYVRPVSSTKRSLPSGPWTRNNGNCRLPPNSGESTTIGSVVTFAVSPPTARMACSTFVIFSCCCLNC